MKHTPTPWYRMAEGSTEKIYVHKHRDLVGYDVEVARVRTVEDAAFIVEACNAHERLKRERAALKEVSNAVAVGYRVGAISGKLAESTFRMAEAAIALCEKGETV